MSKTHLERSLELEVTEEVKNDIVDMNLFVRTMGAQKLDEILAACTEYAEHPKEAALLASRIVFFIYAMHFDLALTAAKSKVEEEHVEDKQE